MEYRDGIKYHEVFPSELEQMKEDGESFVATLELCSHRNKTIFRLVDHANGRMYQIHLADLHDVMLYATIDKAIVTGEWSVVKRGSTFGIYKVRS